MDQRQTEEQADLLALQKFQHNFENSLKSSVIYILRDGALTIGEIEQRIDQSHSQILEQLQELIEDGLVIQQMSEKADGLAYFLTVPAEDLIRQFKESIKWSKQHITF
ncbi:winged helix-turn-helix transcriptional regulator [Exiguobacterium sp. s133]|uniref:winged helix-turn-helix transcriptional regulator n=1 Tax=Exiguobacterium sp. s133 TaxID=2751213 RepID=UPI001BEAF13F|nr:winged helix-turn-helix transcriptional regulator [Exiguobacterium sp. s133]